MAVTAVSFCRRLGFPQTALLTHSESWIKSGHLSPQINVAMHAEMWQPRSVVPAILPSLCNCTGLLGQVNELCCVIHAYL